MTTATLPFRHEAFFYAGWDQFVEGCTAFIRDGLAAGELILVVVNAAKVEALRGALGGDDEGVLFVDMAELGRNPARIIPAWRDFVCRRSAPGHGVRGIGEPIWEARTPAELVECQRHEALLNLAFEGTPAFWLLCPYDTTALPADVLAEARRSHPFVLHGTGSAASPDYVVDIDGPFGHALPPPPTSSRTFPFGGGDLAALRELVVSHAAAAGLDGIRTDELVLAVNELATNSLRHGGGRGTLRVWADRYELVCEVSDAGRIEEPLVGRERPALDQLGGRGLWLVNQLCDLVEIRSSPTGTTVRLHMNRARPEADPGRRP